MESETLVNELTGETMTPPQFHSHLRDLERAVTRLDDVIAGLKAELKSAKQGRDKAVGQLRSAVREMKALSRKAKSSGKSAGRA